MTFCLSRQSPCTERKNKTIQHSDSHSNKPYWWKMILMSGETWRNMCMTTSRSQTQWLNSKFSCMLMLVVLLCVERLYAWHCSHPNVVDIIWGKWKYMYSYIYNTGILYAFMLMVPVLLCVGEIYKRHCSCPNVFDAIWSKWIHKYNSTLYIFILLFRQFQI